MANLQQHMHHHLRSARQWLSRAEESFDRNSPVRGELDLILAQAELQHARENNRSGPVRRFIALLWHGASLALAAIIITTSFGAYWWSQQRPEPVPTAVAVEAPLQRQPAPFDASSSSPTAAEKSELPTLPPEKPPQTTFTPVTESSAPASASGIFRREEVVPVRPAAKDNIVSPEEMQKIIRAAGKSLRGH